MRRNVPQHVALSLSLLGLLFFFGCNKNTETQSAPPQTAASPKAKTQTPFERDLDFVRTSRFTYVFVFSRKDGGTFDKEAIDYLKANSPRETNQWVITDDKRYAIAGTHFEFKPEHFDALGQRFNIEDYTGK